VRKYVREAKMKLGLTQSKVFLPLESDPGREAEADWGQAYAKIAGEIERLHYLCMRSKGSGKPFVRFYRGERQQALFDALMHAFLFFAGVFRILIFDNMKTVVLRILDGRNREEQKSVRKDPNKYSTIIIDRNRYSVPTDLASYPFRVICRVDTFV
jgi:hypothetical protein